MTNSNRSHEPTPSPDAADFIADSVLLYHRDGDQVDIPPTLEKFQELESVTPIGVTDSQTAEHYREIADRSYWLLEPAEKAIFAAIRLDPETTLVLRRQLTVQLEAASNLLEEKRKRLEDLIDEVSELALGVLDGDPDFAGTYAQRRVELSDGLQLNSNAPSRPDRRGGSRGGQRHGPRRSGGPSRQAAAAGGVASGTGQGSTTGASGGANAPVTGGEPSRNSGNAAPVGRIRGLGSAALFRMNTAYINVLEVPNKLHTFFTDQEKGAERRKTTAVIMGIGAVAVGTIAAVMVNQGVDAPHGSFAGMPGLDPSVDRVPSGGGAPSGIETPVVAPGAAEQAALPTVKPNVPPTFVEVTLDEHGEGVQRAIAQEYGYDINDLTPAQSREVIAVSDAAFQADPALMGKDPTKLHLGTTFTIPTAETIADLQPAPTGVAQPSADQLANSNVLDVPYSAATGEGTLSYDVLRHAQELGATPSHEILQGMVEYMTGYNEAARADFGLRNYPLDALPLDYRIFYPPDVQFHEMMRHLLEEADKTSVAN